MTKARFDVESQLEGKDMTKGTTWHSRPCHIMVLAIICAVGTLSPGATEAQKAGAAMSSSAQGFCWTCVDMDESPECTLASCEVVTNLWGYLTCIADNSDECSGGCWVDETIRCMILWSVHLDGSVALDRVPDADVGGPSSTLTQAASTLGAVVRGCREVIIERRYDGDAIDTVRAATRLIDL